jgi:DNA replication protein DnaC
MTRMDFIVLDELGYLPFAQSGGQLLFHLVSRLYERSSIIVTPTSPSANGPGCICRAQFGDRLGKPIKFGLADRRWSG